jgi:hypothetical protein
MKRVRLPRSARRRCHPLPVALDRRRTAHRHEARALGQHGGSAGRRLAGGHLPDRTGPIRVRPAACPPLPWPRSAGSAQPPADTVGPI